PEAFQVEHAEATEAADLDGGGRRDHAVHGGGEERQLEAQPVQLPGDVDVLGVASAAAGNDGDVVEAVGPAARLPQPDLDLGHVQPSPSASPVGIDRTEGPTVAPMIRRLLAAVLLTLALAGVPAVPRADDTTTTTLPVDVGNH